MNQLLATIQDNPPNDLWRYLAGWEALYILGLPIAIIVGLVKLGHDKAKRSKLDDRFKTANQARAEGRCVQCALNMPHTEHDNK